MRVSITREFNFHAAHQLPWHQGKCQRLHGHTYHLEVSVTGPLTEDGIVMDFDDLDHAVAVAVVDKLDHQYLNDFFDNPTAEILAMSFFKDLEAGGLDVVSLTLWETDKSSATVTGDHR